MDSNAQMEDYRLKHKKRFEQYEKEEEEEEEAFLETKKPEQQTLFEEEKLTCAPHEENVDKDYEYAMKLQSEEYKTYENVSKQYDDEKYNEFCIFLILLVLELQMNITLIN